MIDDNTALRAQVRDSCATPESLDVYRTRVRGPKRDRRTSSLARRCDLHSSPLPAGCPATPSQRATRPTAVADTPDSGAIPIKPPSAWISKTWMVRGLPDSEYR